ncbi:hypothetical protein ABIA38_008633 [Embleya sp. AB8]
MADPASGVTDEAWANAAKYYDQDQPPAASSGVCRAATCRAPS